MPSSKKYEVFDRLGHGGMGTVYRGAIRGAADFRKAVAIKRVHQGGDAHAQAAFIREAKISAQLQHPNIVQTLDFDRDEQGDLFLVMELVHGKELTDLLRDHKLPVEVAVGITEQVLEALAYAQSCPTPTGTTCIVHRDISPSNILVTWDGFAKLTDFGVARTIEDTRLTAPFLVKGKPRYMSPEQLLGIELDGRSDLFTVGVILWEMLTGEHLFSRPTDHSSDLQADRVLHGTIPQPLDKNPDVPEVLSEFCLGLLARRREERIASADEALRRIRGLDLSAQHHEIAAYMLQRFTRPAPWSPEEAAAVSAPIPLRSLESLERQFFADGRRVPSTQMDLNPHQATQVLESQAPSQVLSRRSRLFPRLLFAGAGLIVALTAMLAVRSQTSHEELQLQEVRSRPVRLTSRRFVLRGTTSAAPGPGRASSSNKGRPQAREAAEEQLSIEGQMEKANPQLTRAQEAVEPTANRKTSRGSAGPTEGPVKDLILDPFDPNAP